MQLVQKTYFLVSKIYQVRATEQSFENSDFAKSCADRRLSFVVLIERVANVSQSA